MNGRPGITRSLAAAVMGAVAARWLIRLPLAAGRPNSAGLTATVTWWSEAGTPAAVMALARSVGVAAGVYVALVGTLGVIAGVSAMTGRPGGVARLWRVVSTDTIRRMVAVGAIAVWATTPIMASASDDPAPSIVLVDLGPVPDAPPSSIRQPETWVVSPGDHLWYIALRTLTTDGAEPSISETTTYWKRLIADNVSTVGPNPDLIYPGQVLILPERG